MSELNRYDVEEARWELYWQAHKDIMGTDDHPDDRNTPDRQLDYQRWLEKVLTDRNWFIAPGVTREDRIEAQLPTRTIDIYG